MNVKIVNFELGDEMRYKHLHILDLRGFIKMFSEVKCNWFSQVGKTI